MRVVLKILLGVLLSALCVLGCKQSRVKELAPQQPFVSKDKQQLEDVNKYLSEKEQDALQAYIRRQNLKMERMPSGYYVEKLRAGKGSAIAVGDAVRLVGKIWLLDGTPCYTYDAEQPLELVVNGSVGLTGLHLAVQGFKEDAKMRLIFPSYLAHGLLGDGNKIPPRSAIVCELEIMRVVKKVPTSDTER